MSNHLVKMFMKWVKEVY